METQRGARHTRRGAAALFAIVLGSSMVGWGLFATGAHGAFATSLAAEPAQTPMPDDVHAVPEDCKGIAPTPGSKNDTTQKQLNEGQGIVNVGPNSFAPGGTVHWLIRYNPTDKSASFDIRDCVVAFLPGNTHTADVLALVDPNGHGQLIPTPGSEPAVKGYDAELDNAEFEFPDGVALPGEFDLSWTVPADAPPGALICNYAKDTGGTDAGGKENRKAGGACFAVPVVPAVVTTTTTSPKSTSTSTSTTSTSSTSTTSTTTLAPSETTTTTAPTTTTTEAPTTSTSTSTSTTSKVLVLGENALRSAETTTTVPTQVLGEQFSKLATTGGNTADVVAIAGALLVLGGFLLLVSEQRLRISRR